MKLRYVQLCVGKVIVMVAAPEDEAYVGDERLEEAGLVATRHLAMFLGKSHMEPVSVLSVGEAELNA